MMQIEVAGKYSAETIWGRPRRAGAGSLAAALLPFAAGYFLSYWVRTLSGPLAETLGRSFGLGPADLGLLTSLYFLTFAAFQIPAGLLIDRFGPRRVQIGMLLVAAAGGLVFAEAQDRGMLMLGRALIGLGCSSALVTGVKMLSLWLPMERRAMGNALLVLCGGLGATASAVSAAPAGGGEAWRGLFLGFALVAVAISAWIWLGTAERPAAETGGGVGSASGMVRVLRDGGFWRLAPASALIVGTAFAVHGLWAARWLADVAAESAGGVAIDLVVMGGSLAAGALLFGGLASWLRRLGLGTARLFALSGVAFLGAEAMLVAGVWVPPMLSLGVFAMFGAITVLSFTIIGEIFPTALIGRANAALNVLQLGAAFAIQAGFGLVVAQWTPGLDGRLPVGAYATAFAVLMVAQALALVWFVGGLGARTGRETISILKAR